MKNTKSAIGKQLLSHFSAELLSKQITKEEIYAEVYETKEIEKVEEELKKLTGNKYECGRALKEDTIAWSCSDCGLNSSAIICHECYINSNHENHRVSIRRGIKGGRCVCGDSDVWAPSGSCSQHSQDSVDEIGAPENMLTKQIRARAANVLSDLVSLLSSLCLSLEDELGLTGKVVANLEEIKKLRKHIEFLLNVLAHFIEVSPMFINMIATYFLDSSNDSTTYHRCLKELKINGITNYPNPQKNFTTQSHPCTCSHLHNVAKIFFSFPITFQFYLAENILLPLMHNQELKYCIGVSYFANYAHIVPYIYDESILVELTSQFFDYENVVSKILNDEMYLLQIFDQLKRIFEDIRIATKLNMPISLTFIRQLNLVCENLKKLMHTKLLSFYYPCLIKFVECLRVFESIERTSINNKSLEKIGKSLEVQFTFMLSAFDTSKIDLCVLLINAFESAFNKAYENINNVIILHRCLSIFLTNYLLNNYWDHCVNSKDEANIETGLRKVITSLWKLSSIEECEEVTKRWLPGVLKSIGNNLTFYSENDIEVMSYSRETQTSSSLDFCLMVILISLLKPKKNLLYWLVQIMNPSISSEDISIALSSSEKTIAYDRIRSALEVSMHAMCTWISNDILFYTALMNYRKNMMFDKNIIERSKRIAFSYFEYAIARGIVQLFVLKRDSNKGLPFTLIQNIFPEVLKDLNKLEKVLETISTAFIDSKDHIIKFKLQSDSLNLYDPFLLISNKVKSHSLPFKWNVHDPMKADFVFGECAESNEFTGKTKTGLPLIPFRFLITQLFTKSGMITEIMKIVQAQGVTYWIMNCSYKLILACIKHEKDEAIIAEAWRVMGENIEKFMLDLPYNSNHESILRTYQKLINEKSKKAIESHFDEVAELRRKDEQERKERIRAIRQKVKDDFAAKNQIFKEKNNAVLSQSKKSNWQACAYCRETIDEYSTEPHGIQMLMQRSIIYGHKLNQLLKSAIGEYYNDETKFKHVMGRSKGIVFVTCEHWIHLKCCAELLKNPPDNKDNMGNSMNNEGLFMCPICQHCANVLVPPVNEILENKAAGDYFESSVFSKLMKVYCKEDEESNCIEFLTVCRCLTYQMSLIALNDVADFIAKKDVLLGLVYTLKKNMQACDYYKSMQNMQEAMLRDLKFVFKSRHKVFRANVSLIATMFLVSSKVMETSECKDKIYEELKDKLILTIKFAVTQILLRIVYTHIDPAASAETLVRALGAGEWLHLPETLSAIKERLVPFLKRIFCLRTLLWPIPGSDTLTEMTKVSWLCNKNSLEFYAKEFGFNSKFQVADLFEQRTAKKPAYLPLLEVNLEWLSTALNSLARNYTKTRIHLMPKVIVAFDQQPFNFIPLPMYYSELNRAYQRHECSNCGKIKEDWAICLLCESVLCVLTASRKLEDKGVGELTAHSRSCPGGAGIFLRIISNRVLLIDGGYACNYISPYVNKYGESVDIKKNLESGVLRLEQRIVKDLKQIYLKHMVPQIVRAVWLKDIIKYKLFSV